MVWKDKIKNAPHIVREYLSQMVDDGKRRLNRIYPNYSRNAISELAFDVWNNDYRYYELDDKLWGKVNEFFGQDPDEDIADVLQKFLFDALSEEYRYYSDSIDKTKKPIKIARDFNYLMPPTNESRRPRGRMIRESSDDNELVGKQNFTVGEFKDAWKQLEKNVMFDPYITNEEKENLFILRSIFDKRHSGKEIPMSYSKVLEDLIGEETKIGYEYYYIYNVMCRKNYNDKYPYEMLDHGIVIRDGDIYEVF